MKPLGARARFARVALFDPEPLPDPRDALLEGSKP